VAKASQNANWQRSLIVLTGTVVAVVVVLSLYWAQAVFIPLTLAVFLAFVLSPLVTMLQRHGLGRTPAVLAVVLLAGLFLGLVGWGLGHELGEVVAVLPRYKDNIQSKIESVEIMTRGALSDQLQPVFQDLQGTGVSGASGWLSRLPAFLSPVVGSVAEAGLVLVLVVFILFHREDLRDRLLWLAGHGRVTLTTRALDEAGQRLSRYLFTQFVLNAVFGLTLAIGLFCIGVDQALLWGFLGGALRYVPYIGAWIAAILIVALSLAMFPGWMPALAAFGLIVGLELVTGNFLEPWLYGKSLGVSAVAFLIAAAFWAFLWGPIGLVLSGPLMVCLVVLGEYVPQLEFLAVLLSDRPALAGDVSYYQRLSARDQDEAAQIVAAHAEESSMERVYDDLLVPALTYAKRDRQQDRIADHEEKFILQATREIAEDLVENGATSGDQNVERASPNGLETEPAQTVRVLGCPARDEADQVALEMLRKLLDPEKWTMKLAGVELLATELVGLVMELRPAVVCIGSLPPGGLAHTRYLCKRLRARFPNLKILAGRWGLRRGLEENRDQLLEAGADEVANTLLETRRHLDAWWHVLSDQSSADYPAGAARPAEQQV